MRKPGDESNHGDITFLRLTELEELTFLLHMGDRRLALIEAKATRTPVPRSAQSLLRLARAIQRYRVKRFVVHLPLASQRGLTALTPGVRASAADRLVEIWEAEQ